MNVAIIGACGFLGGQLCKALIQRGDTVHAYDRQYSDRLSAKCWFEKLDITRDKIILPKATDAVFYLAQSPHYRAFPDHAADLFTINSVGPIRVAEAARKSSVAAFFYASTGTVYAPSLDPLREDSIISRDTAYAASKLAGEDALKLFQDYFNIVIFRPFGLFGPGQRTMLPVKIRSMIETGDPVGIEPLPGESLESADGLNVSYCYVLDAVTALLSLLNTAVDAGTGVKTVNLAGGEPISIRRLAQSTASLLNRPVEFTALPPRDRNLIADVSHLTECTDVSFTPFEEAMRSTIAANG